MKEKEEEEEEEEEEGQPCDSKQPRSLIGDGAEIGSG